MPIPIQLVVVLIYIKKKGTVLLPRQRGGKAWFAFEGKSFDIEVEEKSKGLKGCIWERRKGVTSWIRFRRRSLSRLLVGYARLSVWVNFWEEGRRYRMERGSNPTGGFIRCLVRDLGGEKL